MLPSIQEGLLHVHCKRRNSTSPSPTPQPPSTLNVASETSEGWTDTESDRPSLFLRLPREIRDIVYQMLLTTTYNYMDVLEPDELDETDETMEQTEFAVRGHIKLHSAILLANRQIFSEATKILYTDNIFIILNSTRGIFQRFRQQLVPVTRRLPKVLIESATLSITLLPLNHKQRWGKRSRMSTVTTPEAMPWVIRNLWSMSSGSELGNFGKDCGIVFELHDKASLQHAFLKECPLKSFNQLHGFVEASLIFKGNFDGKLVQQLTQSMTMWPSLDSLICSLELYLEKADDKFKEENYTAAWAYWSDLEKYWLYCICSERYGILGDAAKVTLNRWAKARVGKVKILLRFQKWRIANALMTSTFLMIRVREDWTRSHLISLVVHAKLRICAAMTRIFLGRHDEGIRDINDAVVLLLDSNLYRSRSFDTIYRELELAINNQLILVGSRRRCASEGEVCPSSEGGKDWQLEDGCASFWDWLGVPEN